MKTEVVQILVRRSETSATNDVVYAHEVPVIRVARGSAKVTLTGADCEDCALKPIDINPRDELIRLRKKYQGFSVEGINPVTVAFPDGSRDIELFYKDPAKFNEALEDVESEDVFNDSEKFESPIPALKPAEATPDKSEREVTMEALTAMKVPFAKSLNNTQLKALLTRKQTEAFEASGGADESDE